MSTPTTADREAQDTQSTPSEQPAAERGRREVQFVLGSTLLVDGLRRRSSWGALEAVGGGALLVRALGGPSALRAGRPERRVQEEQTETEMASPEPEVHRSVTVGRPPEEVADAWRDPETFGQVMGHVADVESLDEDRYRWTIEGPYGRSISWETHHDEGETEDGTEQRWQTPADAVLPNEGIVSFEDAPGGRGTTVTLSVSFDPPGGTLGNRALDYLDIAPRKLAGVALDRFKSLVETGELPTLEGNPSGRGSGDTV